MAALVAVALTAVVAAPSGAAPGGSAASTQADWPPPGRIDLNPGGGVPAAPPGTEAGGVAAAAQGVVDKRAQQYIATSPGSPIYFVAYTGVGNVPASAPTSYGLVYLPDPFEQPACAAGSTDPSAKLRSLYFQDLLYAVWPPTGGPVAGAFPPIRVRTVAFGAIPITATLRLSQTRVKGVLQPLLDQTWSPSATYAAPCDPTYVPPGTSVITGDVDITLTDLQVDGEPVDVGSACRATAPVKVALWGINGYYPGQGGELAQYDGAHAGTLGKLDSPYYGTENGTSIPASTGLDIPAFAGCTSKSGDDVSRLVTAMASGPDNPVSADQSPIISNDTLDIDNLPACRTDGTACPVPAQNPPAMPPH